MKIHVLFYAFLLAALLFSSCEKMEFREDVLVEAISINDEPYDSNNPTQREVENGDTLIVTYRFETPSGLDKFYCTPNLEEDYSHRILSAPEAGVLEGEIVFEFVVEEVIPEDPIGLPIISVMRCVVLDQSGSTGEFRFQFSKPT